MIANRVPWILVVLAMALVAGSALGVVYSSFEARRLIAQHQQLLNEKNAMQVEWGQLLLEQSTWGSYNRVEQLAGARLKMRVPSPNEIVMVDP